MFSHTSRLFRLAFVAVVALIATSAVSLTVVLSHEDTAMAQGAPWPSKPAATPSATAGTAAPTTTGTTGATPTPAPTTAQSSPVAQTSPVASAASSQPSPAAKAPLTYTVKKGDNLTVIAAWFKLHGYGDLYEKNRKTIGSDPDLIRPGQKITISSAGMSTG